jgi:hypothetical protein
MSWLDKSCLQLVVRRKDKTDTLTFQVNLTVVCIVNSTLTTAVNMHCKMPVGHRSCRYGAILGSGLLRYTFSLATPLMLLPMLLIIFNINLSPCCSCTGMVIYFFLSPKALFITMLLQLLRQL